MGLGVLGTYDGDGVEDGVDTVYLAVGDEVIDDEPCTWAHRLAADRAFDGWRGRCPATRGEQGDGAYECQSAHTVILRPSQSAFLGSLLHRM